MATSSTFSVSYSSITSGSWRVHFLRIMAYELSVAPSTSRSISRSGSLMWCALLRILHACWAMRHARQLLPLPVQPSTEY